MATKKPISLENKYLRLRYLLFKKHIERKNWSDRKLVYTNNFDSLYDFEIKDKVFYNDNPVWFSKDTIYLANDGVHIRCYYDPKTHTSWQGTRDCTHTSGMITTKDSAVFSNGVWVVTAKACLSWCAIWLLKLDRNEPMYSRTQITPEIDIMEAMGSSYDVKHSIHYGYSDSEYKKFWINTQGIQKYDNMFHEYAVEILSDGYDFYIDGVLTGKFRSSDPEFVTDCPNYILINNSSDHYTVRNTEFVVKSIKFYE